MKSLLVHLFVDQWEKWVGAVTVGVFFAVLIAQGA